MLRQYPTNTITNPQTDPNNPPSSPKTLLPLDYKYYGTYTPNDTTHFSTLSIQHPLYIFNYENDTHVNGVARLEYLDPDVDYFVRVAPYTAYHKWGYMFGGLVVAIDDPKMKFILALTEQEMMAGTNCFCNLIGQLVPACVADDCSDQWKNPIPLNLVKAKAVQKEANCCGSCKSQANYHECRMNVKYV